MIKGLKHSSLKGINLCCFRGNRWVFQNLNFSVNPGEILHLVGPNGCGKSSLLRIIAGLHPQASGSLEGIIEDRTSFHYISHQNGLKGVLTVKENLKFWAPLYGSAHIKIMDTLARFSLTPLQEVPFMYLSSGQQKRVSLSRLFLAKRVLWLLDEPTVNLDNTSLVKLFEQIKNHSAKGGLIIIASHEDLSNIKPKIFDFRQLITQEAA
jgi:heme exporter protein A